MPKRTSGPDFDTVAVRVWRMEVREAVVDLRLDDEDREELAARGTVVGLTLVEAAIEAADDEHLWGEPVHRETGGERLPEEDGPGPDDDEIPLEEG